MGLHLLGTLVSFSWSESLLIVVSSYSNASWEDIRSIYELIMYEMTIQPKEFPEESLYKSDSPIWAYSFGQGGETATFCGTNPDPSRWSFQRQNQSSHRRADSRKNYQYWRQLRVCGSGRVKKCVLSRRKGWCGTKHGARSLMLWGWV